MTVHIPPGTPALGTTYSLAEQDYRYGCGPLLVRVTQVLGVVEYGDEMWWQVEARCAVPGLAGPARTRTLYVRASALPSVG